MTNKICIGNCTKPKHQQLQRPFDRRPDQIGYSLNNNNNNQLVPFDSEDPFQDANIPDFDLGQIKEKENTILMTQIGGDCTGGMTTNIMQQRQFYQRKSLKYQSSITARLKTLT